MLGLEPREWLVLGVVALVILRLIGSRRRRAEFERRYGGLVKLAHEEQRLRTTDPAAADRVLERFGAEYMQEEGAHRAELLARAPTDRRAAIELHARILEELRADDAMRAELRARSSRDPADIKALEQLNAATDELRDQLTELERILEAR